MIFSPDESVKETRMSAELSLRTAESGRWPSQRRWDDAPRKDEGSRLADARRANMLQKGRLGEYNNGGGVAEELAHSALELFALELVALLARVEQHLDGGGERASRALQAVRRLLPVVPQRTSPHSLPARA